MCYQNHVSHHLSAYFEEALNPVAISVFIWVTFLPRFVHRKTLYFFCFKAVFSILHANYLFNAGVTYFVTVVAEMLSLSRFSRFHYLNRSIHLTIDHFQMKR